MSPGKIRNRNRAPRTGLNLSYGLAMIMCSILLVTMPVLGADKGAGDTAALIAELETDYRAIEKQLASYEDEAKRLKNIGYGGAVLQKDLKTLAARVKALQAELKELDKKLIGGDMVGLIDSPQETQIRISLDTYEGQALENDKPVANSDILAFQADISHIGNPDKEVLANFIWQVIGPGRQQIEDLRKRRQVAKAGGDEPASCGDNPKPKPGCFRIQLEGLSNGDYTVSFTHQNATQPEKLAKSTSSFSIYQPVNLKDLVVDVSSDGKTHHENLFTDQSPHLFAYYELGDGIDQVQADLSLKLKSGRTVDSISETRERKGETRLQRVGLLIEPGDVKPGQTVVFKAVITAPDGSKVEDEVEFLMQSYKISLSVPGRLTSGEAESFRIKVPGQFKPPYKVETDVSSGLILHHSPSRLSGKITGIAEKNSLTARFKVLVTDSDGRSGSAKATVDIQPKPAPKVAAIAPPKPKPKIYYQPKPKKPACRVPSTYYAQAGKFNKLMRVRVDNVRNGIYTVTLTPADGRGWWARGQGKFGPGCRILRHGWYKSFSAKGKLLYEGRYSNDRLLSLR